MNEAASAAAACASDTGEIGTVPRAGVESALCPASRTKGSAVDLITVKALLKSSALRRLDGKSYRFCPERDCDVVYFDWDADSIFDKGDLAVRVGQKETEDPIPLCYCFDFSLADLRTRGADIPALITAEVEAGHCACEVRNPQGFCCLGNLSRALKGIEPASAPRG